MKLTAEQISNNWDELIEYIEKYISSPRKEKVLDFYNKYKERLILIPASHKKEYHNAFAGGYVDHILRVIKASLDINDIWKKYGVDTSTYTIEELIFSALNHDLGKMGDEFQDSYIPQTDNWRREKLGEEYMFNTKVPFASVPDRGLFLLQSHDIQYTFNEMITIQTHDGLWDEANKKYLSTYLPEQKPRTSLPYIIHQADLLAARIEFEKEWFPKFKEENKEKINKNKFSLENKEKTNPSSKNKALKTLKSKGLQNILNSI